MAKRRGRAHKARDLNTLQAVALGMLTLPEPPWNDNDLRNMALRQRHAIKHSCVLAAKDLGWHLRRSTSYIGWEIWRPRMSIPWRPALPALPDIPNDYEQWALQNCCREIMRVSILKEDSA